MKKTRLVLGVMMAAGLVVVGCTTPAVENDDTMQDTGTVVDTGAVAANDDVEVVEAEDEGMVEADMTKVIDVETSTVKRTGKKVTGQHYGMVTVESGEIGFADGEPVNGTVVMDMTTMTVDDLEDGEGLLNHLKSDDFFSVETHPTTSMTMKSFESVEGEENTYTVTADLTIKGITNEVTFPATFNEEMTSATAMISIDRTLRDIKFRSAKFFSDLADSAIDDVFTLEIEVALTE